MKTGFITEMEPEFSIQADGDEVVGIHRQPDIRKPESSRSVHRRVGQLCTYPPTSVTLMYKDKVFSVPKGLVRQKRRMSNHLVVSKGKEVFADAKNVTKP